MHTYTFLFEDEQTALDNLDDAARVAWGVMNNGRPDPEVDQIIRASVRAAAMVFLNREDLK